ncbi:MAG: polysaccharide biosynthesis-like protein [Robiginitomaculum sp.]|nr:MAG: polysaccharide biosynthesis-like protein [Robiginitomaculum sp.]
MIKAIKAQFRRVWMLVFGERERSDYLVQYVKFALACLFGRRSLVKQSWPGGQKSTSGDLVIFAHFDKDGVIHGFVLEYLEQLALAGRRIIFVTNSPKFPDRQRTKLQGKVETILWRANKGYDFGAYADGIKAAGDLGELQSLLLCNDSVYGPVFPLASIFEQMSADTADMWSLTDSWDSHYHLQSYFLLFHKAVLRDAAFVRRWQKYIHVHSKSWVIRKHEIGLSKDAQKAGLRLRSLFRYRDLLDGFITKIGNASILEDTALVPSHRAFLKRIFDHAESGRPLNASHFFWDQLILAGYPFIKRELLQSNPMHIPSLYKWEQLLVAVSKYDTDLINQHLETSMRDRFM